MAGTYRLYLETDLNRVFAQSLGAIAGAELDVVLTHLLGVDGTAIEEIEEGRTSYLRFAFAGTDEELTTAVSGLSSSAALFREHTPTSLEPMPFVDRLAFGTDLVTTQRYKGKTSERLTRLMLGLARACDASKGGGNRTVVDPMCGRGTTLNWALLSGVPAIGLDLDRRALDDSASFLQNWAQGHHYPHRLQRYKKQHSEGRHFDFTVATDRAGLEAKSTPDIRTFNAPAEDPSTPVGKVAMVVTDLPYGIQHRARSQTADIPSSVGELVDAVSSRWAEWVRTGGAVAASWNVTSLARSDVADRLDAAGFDVIETAAFEHRVDRTILRDVIVARRRPPAPSRPDIAADER